MPTELALFYVNDEGVEQRIAVSTNPFTIGRQEGNELVINDPGLSRRHAMITFFSDVAQVTDCGSQNGTFLNGQQLAGNAVLKNGDVLALGQFVKIRVQLQTVAAPVVAANHQPAKPAEPARQNAPAVAPSANAMGVQFSPATLAVVATVAIILVAAGMIAYLALRQPKPTQQQASGSIQETAPPVIIDSPVQIQNSEVNADDQFDKSLIQTIRNISNDQNYPFSPAVKAEIKQQASAFATPALANNLRSLAARGADTTSYIKDQGLKPALLYYLALAETNGGQNGDPVVVARQAVTEVQFLRGHFGSDFADQTLLVVAAYKIPGGSKRSHPLLPRLNQVVRNPQTDRNVWFLREKGALSSEAYGFVLRFLAYGAIAQNPSQFGLDLPALVF